MKIYRNIAFVLFFLFGIVLILVFSGSNGTSEQDFNALVAAVVAFILGCGFMLYFRYGQKPWNEMSFTEQCQQIAKEVSSGKRVWHLNHDGDDYLAVPLSHKNMNEFGGGIHTISNLSMIKDLAQKGKIKNEPLLNEILRFLEPKKK